MKEINSPKSIIKSFFNRGKRLFSKETSVGSIFRNMAIMASGVFFARLIAFAASPVITRIYSPEDYGLLALFSSVLGLMEPFATLKYSVAILLPRKDEMALNILVLCFFQIFFFATLFSIILFFFSESVFSFFSMSPLLSYWWLIPIAFIGMGAYESLTGWATRTKAFKAIAKTKVTQSFSSVITKIFLGWYGFRPAGLLLGNLFSQAGGISTLLLSLKGHKSKFKKISIKRMYFAARYYSDFPIFRLPSQFLLAFSSKAPLLFMAMIYDTKTAGQLGLAFSMIALPMSLLGRTTSQAYYSEIAKIGIKQPLKIKAITLSLMKKMFFISILPALLIYFYGGVLFSFVFGINWEMAGIFASELSLYMVASFVCAPVVTLVNVIQKQIVYLIINLLRVVLLTCTFIAAFYLKLTAISTITLFSIVYMLIYIFISYYLLHLLKKECETQTNLKE